MKWVTAFAFILCFFSATLAAENSVINVDLKSQLEKASQFDNAQCFLNSEDWIYGIDSSGLPVFRHTFSLPSAQKPVLLTAAVNGISENITFDTDKIAYSDISTDAEGLLRKYPRNSINLQNYGELKAAIELRFSDGFRDYYNLYINPFIIDSNGLKFVIAESITIELTESADTKSPLLNPARESVMQDVISQLAQSESTGMFTKSHISQISRSYGDSADYIIITNDELAESFESFVLWKRSLGYNANIKLIDDIESEYAGLDLAEKIREYLKQAWQDGLEWVLLGGDETIIPVRKLYSANTNEPVDDAYQHPSDLYYADLTGEWEIDGDGVWGEPYHDNPDLQPELFVGRVSACTPGEVANWAEKSIAYENGEIVDMNGFAEKAMITSADQMRDWNNGQGQDSLIAEYFPDNIPVDLGSMAEYPSGYDESPSQPPAKDFIQHYSEGWNMAVILAHGICEGFVSMSSGYNQWPKTYVWIGSGGRSDKGYLDNLGNYGRSGIIYSVSCSQGAFDRDNSESRCFAEYITNLKDRGAAAFIGYSRYGWVASSFKLAEKFVEAVYTADNRIGPANTISKLYHSNYRDLNYGLNLFGDPSLLIWTETPDSIEVEHPEIISLSDNSFIVSVNSDGQALDNALVTVITEDENLICDYTDLNGLLDLNFNTGIDSSVVLTVSKNGYKPYQAEIYTSIVLDADDEDDYENVPRAYELHQNYPNPANPATNIGFYLPKQNDIQLEIFNLLGQKVFSVEEYGLEVGYHEIEIDLSNHPSGVYFYRLNAAEFYDVRKLVLLK